jgi:hypothetical protein
MFFRRKKLPATQDLGPYRENVAPKKDASSGSIERVITCIAAVLIGGGGTLFWTWILSARLPWIWWIGAPLAPVIAYLTGRNAWRHPSRWYLYRN